MCFFLIKNEKTGLFDPSQLIKLISFNSSVDELIRKSD